MDRELHFSIEGDLDMRFYSALSGGVNPPRAYPHHIENTIELFILVEGDVSFAVESRVYRMSPGDIILTKPNEMHHCITNSATVNHHYCFYFKPSPHSIFESFLEHSFGCDNLISPVEEDRTTILDLASKIDTAENNRENSLDVLALVMQLLAAVRRNIGKNVDSEALPEALELAFSEMDEHISENISIDELCAKLFISYSTLARLFKKHLGTTPRAYLESKRLAVARRMLKDGAGVSETCRAIGFSDSSSFIRLFKQRFGETPLKYSQKQVNFAKST